MPPRLGEQRREISRPGAEGRGLFQQHRMPGERLLESPAERHGITFGAGTFAQIAVCRQNLPAAVYERSPPSGHDARRRPCAGYPARYGPACCRSPPPVPGPPRSGPCARRIGFYPPRTFSRRFSHLSPRPCSRARPPSAVERDQRSARYARTSVSVTATSRSLSARLSAISRASGVPGSRKCRASRDGASRRDRWSRARASHPPAGMSGPRSAPGRR